MTRHQEINIRQPSDKAGDAAGTYHSLAGCMHMVEVCTGEALTQHDMDSKLVLDS